MDTEQKESDRLKRKNEHLQFCLDKEVLNVMNLTSALQSMKQQRDELLEALKIIDDGDVDTIDDAIMVARLAIAKAVSNG